MKISSGVTLKSIPVSPNSDYMAGDDGRIYSRTQYAGPGVKAYVDPILQIVDNPAAPEPEADSPIVSTLKSMLASLPEPGHLIRGLTADVIVDLVAERFDLDREVLFSKARPNRIAWPRQVAMYLIRQLLQWTYEDIGDLFNRDHGTAIWACRTVGGQMKAYPKCQAQIIELQNALRIEAGEGK